MADNLSPLVNLDLINQIYRTINAQITERVYDPLYYPKATLGSKANKYKSAWISGNTSTGTLNDLTLTKATAGFTISGGETTSKMLTVADTATINKSLEVTAATSITGTLTVSAATNIIKGLTVGTTSTGAVTIQSSGAGRTTIEGPSGGTATFTAPTSDVPGSLQIKNNSYTSTVSVAHGKTISTHSNLTVGESGNTGDVVIRPKNTYKLTIASNDTNATTAILRNGTCVITDDYAENNTAGKLVKRDSNSNINVTSVNSVGITGGKENSTDKITLSKGNANINVTGASLSVSKNLKVLSVATLGEASTGNVTVKSAGAKDTIIVGPNGGKAAELIGGVYTTSATTENSTTPTSDKLLKIGTVDAKKFLAGPASSSGIASYRTIVDSDLPEASASTSGIVTTDTQTFAGAKTFADTTDSTNNTSGAVIVSGGLGVAKNIYAAAVHNAVFNDLADCIPVDDGCKVEPGYCYCFDGEKYYKSSKYLDEGIIGIDSDTYGMNMGRKPDLNQMDVAVAGFVLAYVDKEYKPGTPLTCTENGYLTEIKREDKIEYPERIVATYWKSEPADEWGSDSRKVRVNGRKWVKVK